MLGEIFSNSESSVFLTLFLKHELNKRIIIENSASSSFTPVGYDLRIGAAYSPGEFNNTLFEDGTEFILLPGHSLQILCKEFIWLSPFIIASIHSRGSFAAKGLILNSTTIDPNWSGPMALALYNASSTPITLHIGERFCTVIFFYCKTPTLSAPTSRAIEGANSVAFTDYINSNVYSQINSIFETKKQKALSRPSYWIQQLKWKITSLFFQKVNKNTIFLFLFILFCIIGLCLMLGAYKFLKLHYHWSNNSIAFFLAYLSICISLLIAWLSSH